MNLRSRWTAAAGHGMRAYYIPIASGALLIVSAFLPWVYIGDVRFGGVPEIAGLWILALGALAVILASLSIVTRRNSRHPLLVVGLAALGILFVAFRLMARSAAEQVWAASQARAIVEGGAAPSPPAAALGAGVYTGLAAAMALVIFGLTIVVKRVARPYAPPEDDDV